MIQLTLGQTTYRVRSNHLIGSKGLRTYNMRISTNGGPHPPNREMDRYVYTNKYPPERTGTLKRTSNEMSENVTSDEEKRQRSKSTRRARSRERYGNEEKSRRRRRSREDSRSISPRRRSVRRERADRDGTKQERGQYVRYADRYQPDEDSDVEIVEREDVLRAKAPRRQHANVHALIKGKNARVGARGECVRPDGRDTVVTKRNSEAAEQIRIKKDVQATERRNNFLDTSSKPYSSKYSTAKSFSAKLWKDSRIMTWAKEIMFRDETAMEDIINFKKQRIEDKRNAVNASIATCFQILEVHFLNNEQLARFMDDINTLQDMKSLALDSNNQAISQDFKDKCRRLANRVAPTVDAISKWYNSDPVLF